MKKLVSSLVLASILFTALPSKRAEAGILVIAGSIAVSGNNMAVGMGGGAVGFAIVLIGLSGGLPLVVLGTDGSISQDKLESSLNEKYSFIGDRDVTSELASMIKAKAEAATPVNDKIEVKLSREEVLEVIRPTSLLETHPKEVEAMIQELM